MKNPIMSPYLIGLTNKILELVPGSITSGVRTASRNALVGGVKNSDHLTGDALDVVFDTNDDFERAWALAISEDFTQLVRYNKTREIHFAYAPERKTARRLVLR